MYKACFLILACWVSLTACKFNPNYQGRGEDLLEGKWEEVAPTYGDSLIQYTRHSFNFTCDSVYVTLETRAKANYYPDSCFNGGRWKEFAKGNYVLKNDTLYIISTFTKPNFKQKLSGCYRIGQYTPSFIIKNKAKDKLQLQGLQQHSPISLVLKEKTNCVPKPL
jgi:hypothetical protein